MLILESGVKTDFIVDLVAARLRQKAAFLSKLLDFVRGPCFSDPKFVCSERSQFPEKSRKLVESGVAHAQLCCHFLSHLPQHLGEPKRPPGEDRMFFQELWRWKRLFALW